MAVRGSRSGVVAEVAHADLLGLERAAGHARLEADATAGRHVVQLFQVLDRVVAHRGATLSGVETRQIAIRGDMIRLGQLLKLADLVDSGGEVRDLLDNEGVTVNGEPESRRGRQLHPGDVVSAIDTVLEIVPIDT